MPQTPPPAIADMIGKATNILIVTPRYSAPDTTASALALYGYLQIQQKTVKLIAEASDVPEPYSFLNYREGLDNNGGTDKEFVINVSLSKTKVKEFRYDVAGDTLRIYLTPESGMFEANDVSAAESKLPYDLIITIGATNYERLGNIFARHRDFFYTTAVINIDNQSANENFGQVNYVVVAAPSISEIVADILFQMKPQPLPEQVSTNLLAGIIAATNIFRSQGIIPQTFTTAAKLLEQGARHDLIMRSLNQTKSVEMLKIWGEALTRTHSVCEGRLLIASLPREIMQKISGTIDRHQLHQLVDELLIHAPHTLVIALLYEPANSQATELLLRTKKHIDPLDIFPAITFIQKQNCYHHSFTQPTADVEKVLTAAVNGYLQKV